LYIATYYLLSNYIDEKGVSLVGAKIANTIKKATDTPTSGTPGRGGDYEKQCKYSQQP
jgi:hypothetical protein